MERKMEAANDAELLRETRGTQTSVADKSVSLGYRSTSFNGQFYHRMKSEMKD